MPWWVVLTVALEPSCFCTVPQALAVVEPCSVPLASSWTCQKIRSYGWCTTVPTMPPCCAWAHPVALGSCSPAARAEARAPILGAPTANGTARREASLVEAVMVVLLTCD